MNPRPRILLDCDPGIDDAFAIFCAVKFADVAAITTVSGNVSIDNTTRNARYLAELAGADIPVHRGAAAPLEVVGVAADDIHGRYGLGYEEVPEAAAGERSTGAVEEIAGFCENGNAIIVATGPLTNIALALLTDPMLADRISHLYWMGGGSTGGNVTELAEFNAWVDPHATDIVVSSGVPLTMFDLNLTHQVRMSGKEISMLAAAGTASANVLARCLEFYRSNGLNNDLGQPMHDPCAVLGLTHPELFTVAKSRIISPVADDEQRGRTVVHQTASETPHNIATHVDAPAAIELIIAAATDPTPISP